MKLSKVIDYLKWFFALAIFGVAIYAIYNAWQAGKNFVKPSKYKKGDKQTWFEKNFPNVAEAKDKILEPFKATEYKTGNDESFFERNFPNIAEAKDRVIRAFDFVNVNTDKPVKIGLPESDNAVIPESIHKDKIFVPSKVKRILGVSEKMLID